MDNYRIPTGYIHYYRITSFLYFYAMKNTGRQCSQKMHSRRGKFFISISRCVEINAIINLCKTHTIKQLWN